MCFPFGASLYPCASRSGRWTNVVSRWPWSFFHYILTSNPVLAVVPDWTLECDEESTMVLSKRTPNRGSWASLSMEFGSWDCRQQAESFKSTCFHRDRSTHFFVEASIHPSIHLPHNILQKSPTMALFKPFHRPHSSKTTNILVASDNGKISKRFQAL